MVRQINDKTNHAYKAILALIIAGGGLLWHLLACTESPMAFSPDGQNLAFVVAQPSVDFVEPEKSKVVFQLMVLSQSKDLRVVEETSQYTLTGPAYSPNGNHLCYFRLPIISQEISEEIGDSLEELINQLEDIESSADEVLPKLPVTSDPNSLIGISHTDLTLPTLQETYQITRAMMLAPPLPATLVVRDAQNFNTIYTMETEIPFFVQPEALSYTYYTAMPQYSPDSKWIYLPANGMIQAINPQTRQVRKLAAPVPVTIEDAPITVAVLSPDGQTIAALMGDEEPIVAFFKTDGRTTLYHRLDFEVSLAGMAWKDNNTLALLTPSEDKKNRPNTEINFVQTDGDVLRPLVLHLPEHSLDESDMITSELALAPNGEYMVVSFGQVIFFLTTDGKILKPIMLSEGAKLVRPTFSPDSQSVAFKHISEKDDSLVLSIDFFTPEGREISQFKIPPIR